MIRSDGKGTRLRDVLRHIRRFSRAKCAEVLLALVLLVANYCVADDRSLSILFEWAALTYALYAFNIFRLLRIRVPAWRTLSVSLHLSAAATVLLILVELGWLQFLPQIGGVTDRGIVLEIWLSQILQNPFVPLITVSMLLLHLPIYGFVILPSLHFLDEISKPDSTDVGHSSRAHMGARTYVLGSIAVFGIIFSFGEIFPSSVSLLYSSLLIVSGSYAILVKESGVMSEDDLANYFIRILLRPNGLVLLLLIVGAIGYAHLLLSNIGELYAYHFLHYFQLQLSTVILYAYIVVFVSFYPLLLLLALTRHYLSAKRDELTLPFHTTALLITYASLPWFLATYVGPTNSGVDTGVFLILMVVLVAWPIVLGAFRLLHRKGVPLNRRNVRLLTVALSCFYATIYARLAAESGLLSRGLVAGAALVGGMVLAIAIGHYALIPERRRNLTKWEFLYTAICAIATLVFSSSPPALWPLVLISWFAFGNVAVRLGSVRISTGQKKAQNTLSRM